MLQNLQTRFIELSDLLQGYPNKTNTLMIQQYCYSVVLSTCDNVAVSELLGQPLQVFNKLFQLIEKLGDKQCEHNLEQLIDRLATS